MARVYAVIRVDRSGGGYLVRVRVKGPKGVRAKGHLAEVAEQDIKAAMDSLVRALSDEVDPTPS